MPKNGFNLAEPSSHCSKFGETVTRICFGAKQYFILIENLHLALQTNCSKFGETTRISFELTKDFHFHSHWKLVSRNSFYLSVAFSAATLRGLWHSSDNQKQGPKKMRSKDELVCLHEVGSNVFVLHKTSNPEHLKHLGKIPKLSPGLGKWNFEDESGIEWRCICIDYILSLYE